MTANMKKITAILVLIGATVIFAASASAQTLTITNSYANCRSRAGAANAYLGKVYEGQSYDILGSAKAPNGKLWYKIRANGRECYICSSFVRVNPNSTPKVASKSDSKRRFIGTYYVTGYCYYCNSPRKSYQTATGTNNAKAGQTCAVNLGELYKFPYGTKLYIEGLGERVVNDNGCDENVIDVFCAAHSDESKITGYRKIWIVED